MSYEYEYKIDQKLWRASENHIQLLALPYFPYKGHKIENNLIRDDEIRYGSMPISVYHIVSKQQYLKWAKLEYGPCRQNAHVKQVGIQFRLLYSMMHVKANMFVHSQLLSHLHL